MKYGTLIGFFLCVMASELPAQKKSTIRFGKITPADFKTTVYSIDSNASAVVIADIGSTEIVASPRGGLALEFKHFRRVRILNQNGYDAGNIEVPLYASGAEEEKLLRIKASTYNLENGRVVETKLNPKSETFTDRKTQNWTYKKFTFPNIREGSVIEYEYTISSDFLFNLRAWEFQGNYPELWSEYQVSIPEFLYYVFLSQGYRQYDINETDVQRTIFSLLVDGNVVSDWSRIPANVTRYRWVMKNVNALKEENFTSTLKNHICRISFQLAEYRQPLAPRNVMSSWEQVCEELLKREDFGYQLSRDNGWLSDAVIAAAGGAKEQPDIARNIFTYVRDNMTCTSYNAILMEKNLRNILRMRKGSVAEINLLLTAMLKKAGLTAEPVILSTREHGYTYDLYPVLEQFNYVIVLLTIGSQAYYLDASDPQLGFSRLGYECYNGHARVVTEQAPSVYLYADSVVETKLTSVLLVNDGHGGLAGSMQQLPGYFESGSLRSRIKSEGEDRFFSDLKKGFGADMEITGRSIDQLKEYDNPVKIGIDFSIRPDDDDIVYFNPVLQDRWKENPFKSARRLYPVEMPYPADEIYSLRMDVPDGYVIDELPRQTVIRLNEDDDIVFDYRVSVSANTVSLRSRLSIKRVFYQPEEYELLREFFNLVVKKHAEQIVFKKATK